MGMRGHRMWYIRGIVVLQGKSIGRMMRKGEAA